MVTHDNDLARAVSRTIVLSDGEIIDEYLAKVFPALTEAQLVEITRELEPLKFPPGAVIVRRDDPVDRFYLVTRGEVDILVRREGGREFAVTTMSRGQFFGEIELLSGSRAIATARAGVESGAELAALDLDEFQALLGTSEAVRDAIERTAHEREAEHLRVEHENA